MTANTIKTLARKIATDLFTNGVGDVADRLVLMQEPAGEKPRNLGGWCREAIADQIGNAIAAELVREKRRVRRAAKKGR